MAVGAPCASARVWRRCQDRRGLLRDSRHGAEGRRSLDAHAGLPELVCGAGHRGQRRLVQFIGERAEHERGHPPLE
eukprot:8874606-Alexandrium_andersonii.AAC.1